MLLGQLKSVPPSDLELQQRLYTKLSELDPSSRDYRSKRESIEQQLTKKRVTEALLSNQKANPQNYVFLENFSWSKEGFGSVMVANFSIKNTLPWPVKDIELRCTHSAPSGTTIDRNTRTIYERIEANKVKRINNFSMGFIHSQASRSGCEIKSVVAVQ